MTGNSGEAKLDCPRDGIICPGKCRRQSDFHYYLPDARHLTQFDTVRAVQFS